MLPGFVIASPKLVCRQTHSLVRLYSYRTRAQDQDTLYSEGTGYRRIPEVLSKIPLQGYHKETQSGKSPPFLLVNSEKEKKEI